MKKFAAALLSAIMFFSVSTATVLAEPGVDELSAPEEETLLSEQETEGNTSEQSDDQTTDGQFEEPNTEDETGEESDDTEGEEEAESDEPFEDPDSITEDEDEEEDELEEESEEDEEVEDEVDTLAIVPFSVEEYVEVVKLRDLELYYDDRYDLSVLEGISADVEYTIYNDEGEGIISYQVSNGVRLDEKDESLLTQKEVGSTEVIASGVGSGEVWLVESDQVDDLDNILSLEDTYISDSIDSEDENLGTEDLDYEDLTDENRDAENPDNEDVDGNVTDNGIAVEFADTGNLEHVTVYQIQVTVNPATLTLMFLTGQSNMEGSYSSSFGREYSVACEEGVVYSTYAPSTISCGRDIANVSESCSAGNASDFVAGSLQEGTNMSGGELAYPLNSLTTEGGGKAGPDSGLAYEWNQLTGDKVWVINTAYGNSNISGWVSSGTYYQRSVAVWNEVLKTYNAEVGNHYTAGDKFVFWLQGETGDRTLAASDYESYFDSMYYSMSSVLNPTAFGIIMVRAGTGSYTTDDEWNMTGPRIAQYWLGSGSSGYSNVYVVSNVNEQWVSDQGVASYFQNAYPDGALSYPMHGGGASLPETVNAVHSDIHYSQIGHNENGITAADGMYKALNHASPTGVSWRDDAGQEISSASFDLEGDTTTMVEVVEPVYSAKSVSYDYGNYASYDGATGTLTGNSTGNISASYGGNTISQFSIEVTQSLNISGTIGKVTGLYQYSGTWWYVIDGIIQRGYEGLQQNDAGWWYVYDGKVNFSYTGFAQNSKGWWYIEEGKVKFSENNVIQDTHKKIDGTDGWWYVVGGQVQTSYAGVTNYKNSAGYWYVENGRVDFSANTVAQNDYGWWYVDGGKVQFSYNGFGKNSAGWWYIKEGKVIFSTNGVFQDTNKKIDGTDGWWYVVGGQVQTSYTNVVNYTNSAGWWYVKNGKVDFSANTVAQNNAGWWYVVGGKVQFGYTGVANYSNSAGWWYIKDGKVDFSANTVAQNNYGWWYVDGGKVDFSFNGIAKNSAGWWYIKDGKVDFSFNGTVKVSGKTYSVNNGKVDR